jgi:hypothetical protein
VNTPLLVKQVDGVFTVAGIGSPHTPEDIGEQLDIPFGLTKGSDSFVNGAGETFHIAVLQQRPDFGNNDAGASIPFGAADGPGMFGMDTTPETDFEIDDEVIEGHASAEGGRNYSFNFTVNWGMNQDTDFDGLPDFVEDANGLDKNDAADAALDKDGDGVSNLDEFKNKTDLGKKDTDDDGLEDGVETGTGTFVDATNTGTDPLSNDTDEDGLLDGVETGTGTFVDATNTGTDPNKVDSDEDTFGDGLELKAGTDPTDPSSKPSGGLLAAWDFEDSGDDSGAVDLVNGIVAENQGAEYADDPERGSVINFETGSLWVEDASFLNLASEIDQVTFMFWQLNSDTVNSSTFWAVSPSSSGTARGAQAHVPWSNGNIYFDTAGCCDGNQRGNFVPSIEFLDEEWHHYAFVKDGEDKRIYVDGILEFEIVNPSPLPDDFTELWLGSAQEGASLVMAQVDDFGIYSLALSVEQINEVKDNGFGGGGLPFQIIEVTRKGPSNAEVTWQSKAGRFYSIDFTSDLTEGGWIEGTDGFEADGDTATYEDDTLTPEIKERYYRIREE